MRIAHLFKAALLGSALLAPAALAQSAIDADDIAGTVKSAKGPEAGVWVIAEASGLPTTYIKSVVTDDQGRFVIPDLPAGAKYKVWVRGYGLVDSKPVDAQPGNASLNLTATVAPSPKAAAEIYPAAWWYALLNPPAESNFPGTGAKGNGISPLMATQQHWLQNMKENCMFCHQLGDRATRELEAADHVEGWAQRIQMARPDERGQTKPNGMMINNMTRFGRDQGIAMFADWTKRIQAGELPKSAPPRPQGAERNIVVTVRDWAGGHFIHDQISSDHRDPNVNAKGPIYGMGIRTGDLHIFDPVSLKSSVVPIPSVDGTGKSPQGAVHANEMDAKGRVWMATIYREGPDPTWCRDGSTPSSKYFPLPNYKEGGATLPYYDPKTGKVEVIPICVGGNHSNFTYDKDSTLYLSGDTDAIGWLNTRIWDETHDPKKASGWCPMVLDTNGDGKIDPDRKNWNVKKVDLFGGGENAGPDRSVQGSAKIDPTKDTQINAYLYGMGVGKDGSVWQAAYVPYVPSAIIRLIPGNNPPETCKTEIYEPPMIAPGKYAAVGVRGVNVDADGNAWAAFSSGQVGRFDPKKCKVTNGPTATGQHCPEGWTIYDLPVPKVGNTMATSDFVYSEWNDYTGVMGLGRDAKFFPAINSDSIVALANNGDKFTVFRVPYPMGFYTRGLDFRIDDPKAGWKGKTMQATYASSTMWHQEDGEASGSKIVTFQMRPDPLAH